VVFVGEEVDAEGYQVPQRLDDDVEVAIISPVLILEASKLGIVGRHCCF
jgi:hypothetical protein